MDALRFPFPPFPDYALLDSGGGEKLERFGDVVLRRPDPQALWRRARQESAWNAADLVFVRESDRGGRWERGAARSARPGAPPGEWTVGFGAARFLIRPTPFKHVGLFPEQAPNWVRVAELARSFGVAKPRLLNLFGYTGAASVLAAQAGYDVTHVDASKTSVAWLRENAAASGLEPTAMRVIVDDAVTFARREERRGARYHVVLLDPPHHGRGPKGELWQFEEHVAALVDCVRALLEGRAFVVLSTYAIGCSPLTLHNLLGELGLGDEVAIEAGELSLPTAPDAATPPASDGGRLLPAGFCARWSRGLGRNPTVRGEGERVDGARAATPPSEPPPPGRPHERGAR